MELFAKAEAPKKKPKKTRFAVATYLSPELYAKLQFLKRETGWTASKIVAHLIEFGAEHIGDAKK